MLRRISPIHKGGNPSPQQRELMESLQQAHLALAQAHLTFDEAVDPELVESCIFEIRALQARINYLLRRMKEAEEEEQAAAAARGGGKRKWV